MNAVRRQRSNSDCRSHALTIQIVRVLTVATLVAGSVCAVDARDDVRDELDSVRENLQKAEDLDKERAEKLTTLMDDTRALDARLLSSSRNRVGLEVEEAVLEEEYHVHVERLDMLEEEYGKQRSLLARRLASIYKQGRLGSTRALFHAAASTEPIRMARYLAAVSQADSAALADYEAVRRKHRDAIAGLESKKIDIAEKKQALKTELARYEQARTEKNDLLASIEKDLAAARVATARLRASEEELQKIITASARPGASSKDGDSISRAERDSAKKDKPSRLARLFRRRKEPSFSDRKGELTVPVHGEIMARFGDRPDVGPSSHGVVVRARDDLDVVAVGAGEVVFSGPFPGLGKTIIVNHGDRYYTVYAHLDAIRHEVGGHVLANEVVGRLGGAEPILHFELRAEGKALDPEPWFKGGYAAFRR